MALKTFNVDEGVYMRFSSYCKESGISMSKQVELFMRSFLEEEPTARKEYLDRLDRIRTGKFLRVKDFGKEFGVK